MSYGLLNITNDVYEIFPNQKDKGSKAQEDSGIIWGMGKKTKCHIFKAVFFRDFLEVVRNFTL